MRPSTVPAVDCAGSPTRSQQLLRHLASIYARNLQTVAVLRDHFSVSTPPSSWEHWDRLPVTNAELYAALGDVRQAVRDPERLYSPVAPLDLTNPTFPLTVMQSYEDTLCLDERVEHMLRLAGFQNAQPIVLIAGRNQRYAASDLTELLINLKKQCLIILVDRLDDAALARSVAHLGSCLVIWLCPDRLPPTRLLASIPAIITVNGTARLSATVRHVRVLQLDALPYFAASRDGNFYSVVPGHFHLDRGPIGKLLVTTLRQDLQPLLRYQTDWTAHVGHEGFALVQ